ncbi:MAG: HAMP domain-containing sensor histidine kinase [Eubacteriales bacterium]|nr:HAMP domain-containing sensor histidine kinase [Eubacteriales bacterium]
MKRIKELVRKTGIERYLKSLQFRIFIIFFMVSIIPILLMKMSILKNYEEQSILQRSRMMQNQADYLAVKIGENCLGDEMQLAELSEEIEQFSKLYDGRLVVINTDYQIIEDSYALDVGKYLVTKEAMKSMAGQYSSVQSSAYNFIEMSLPVYNKKNNQLMGVLVVSSQTTDIMENRTELSKKVFLLQIALIAIVLIAAFYSSRILVRPFARVTAALEKVSGGFLENDLLILDYTETRDMSEAYNQMLARMKAVDDSRQEFVSNVSHELKTPITSMKVLADSLLMQPDVPVELYQEFMTDIAEEIERENKIINDLLSLVKMDKKASDVNIQSTNINELIELILKRLRPIAAKKEIELVLDSYKPVMAEVDETKLTLALSNLVENAIKYNNDGGWVHLSINTDHKYFYIKVEDNGIGIPKEDQEHIFERFYRVDKSHSREIGGTGLGLAITRQAILMHNGMIKVFSEEGHGTTFTVRVPLVYQA